MEKIIELISSRRFQQLTIGLILLILAFYKVIPQELANLISGFLGISVTVGTIDKIADKISNSN